MNQAGHRSVQMVRRYMRRLLQWYRSEFRCAQDPNYLMDALNSWWANDNVTEHVVVTDCRFANEVIWGLIDYRASRGLDKSVIRALVQKSAWVTDQRR